MQYVGSIENRGHEIRRADVFSLAIIRGTAECRRTERIITDAGQRMGGIGSLRIRCRRRAETTGKPSPSDTLFVQQVADVLSSHFDRHFACDCAALVIAAIIEVRTL